MVEIIDLKDEKADDYYEMLTVEGQECLEMMGSIVLGISYDSKPAGAIALYDDEEGAAQIASVYILPEYRRKGLGTELVYMASSYILNSEGIYRIEVKIPQNFDDDNGLKGFFEWLDFSLSKDEEHGSYSVTLGDIASSEVISKAKAGDFYPFNKTMSAVKNCLMAEHPSLRPIIGGGAIEENMSCFTDNEMSSESLPDCLIFSKEEDELVMVWAQAEKNKIDLVKMFKYAFDVAIKEYGPEKKVRIPYINDNSKKLIAKILGDKAKETEAVWTGCLALDGEYEEEEADIEADLFA